MKVPKSVKWGMYIAQAYHGGANIGKGYKHIGGQQDPKDYTKKKKAKRRQQKQARRKNK